MAEKETQGGEKVGDLLVVEVSQGDQKVYTRRGGSVLKWVGRGWKMSRKGQIWEHVRRRGGLGGGGSTREGRGIQEEVGGGV